MIKRILLTTLLSMGLVPLLATAQTPGVQQAVDQAVDTFEDKRLSPLSLTEQIKLVDSIITAINDLLMRSTRPAGSLHLEVITTLKTTLQDLLIDLRAQRDTLPTPSPSPTPAPVIIEAPSSTTPPQTPQPVSSTGKFPTSIPTIQITHQPLLLLGGQITPPVTNFEMVASGEDILVKELSILINGDHRAINSLALYDDSGKIIAHKRVSSDTVSFKGLDLLVPKGSYDIYPVLEARSIGYGEAGVANSIIRLTLRVDDTRGINSNKPVGVNNNYISSREVVVTPTLVSVASTSDANRALYLSESTLMDLAVTAAPQSNTLATSSSQLETVLQQLQFRLFETNIASADFELKRVNALRPQSNSIAGVRDQSAQTLSFGLSSRSEDNAIIDGTVAYQITISNIVPVDSSRRTSAHLLMDASNADAVIFGSNESSYGIYSLPLTEDITGYHLRTD